MGPKMTVWEAKDSRMGMEGPFSIVIPEWSRGVLYSTLPTNLRTVQYIQWYGEGDSISSRAGQSD